MKEQSRHLNLCEVQKKDNQLQHQQCQLRIKLCGVSKKQGENKKKLDMIDGEIKDLDKKRAVLHKREQQQKKEIQTKSLDELRQQLNGVW